MFDLKDIRNNPEKYDAGWARRGLDAQTPTILDLDVQRRGVQTELQELQSERKVKSAEVGKIKSQRGDADSIMAEVALLKDKMSDLEHKDKDLGENIKTILSALPNIMDADVPDGVDEDENIELRLFKDRQIGNENHADHVTIGEKLGMMDFETAAKMSGSRFVVLRGAVAKLERALAQLMLDTHTVEHGYTEINVPLLVNTEAMYGTSQLPKFEDDQFQTTDGRWLLPTSEVALTNLVRESILDNLDEPIRVTGYTPCFRKEAGSAGRDTRGMIRNHQFHKVEMVSITRPEDSKAEHERMTECAEAILKKLDLPFRTIMLCSGDTGFGSTKTYDLEVWLPGQQQYREVSSCSNMGDFQARRMNARFKTEGQKSNEFVHTLNGSGLALSRTVPAVMENYWDADTQSIIVPEVLKPYMGGIDRIKA